MSYHHPIYQANGYYAFSSRRTELVSGPPRFNILLEMCAGIRITGCCCLLIDADARLFSQCLSVSGNAYAHFLQYIPPGEQVISRGEPFFDALACNDLAAGRLIAERSSHAVRPDVEYEEDALYFRFLFELLFLQGSPDRCDSLLRDYARIVQAEPDPRLAMGHALLERDADRFASALEAQIDRRQAHVNRLAERDGLPDERLSTEGRVFIEGLAMLRIADRFHIPTEKHYPLIPSLTRIDYSRDFAPDDWRTF
jgi:hypothetical protein